MQPLSEPQDLTPGPASDRRSSGLAIAAGFAAVAIVAGAGALWMQYGTAVFFETIAAGLRACF
jgi:hypothetical protein